MSKHFGQEPERTIPVVAHPRFSEGLTDQSLGMAKELWNGLTTRKPDQCSGTYATQFVSANLRYRSTSATNEKRVS